MSRGFNSVKRNSETLIQRDMKQTDYEHLEKLYQYDNARTINAKIWFRRPPYHCRKAYEEWKTRRSVITE